MRRIERLDQPSAQRFEQVVPGRKVDIEGTLRRSRLAHDVLDAHRRAVPLQEPLGLR